MRAGSNTKRHGIGRYPFRGHYKGGIHIPPHLSSSLRSAPHHYMKKLGPLSEISQNQSQTNYDGYLLIIVTAKHFPKQHRSTKLYNKSNVYILRCQRFCLETWCMSWFGRSMFVHFLPRTSLVCKIPYRLIST